MLEKWKQSLDVICIMQYYFWDECYGDLFVIENRISHIYAMIVISLQMADLTELPSGCVYGVKTQNVQHDNLKPVDLFDQPRWYWYKM